MCCKGSEPHATNLAHEHVCVFMFTFILCVYMNVFRYILY